VYARDGIDSRSWFPPDDVDGQYVGELFKALKQNLRLKTFVGTSENALQTQIWTGLIAMLLIKYLQLRASFGWSLSNLVASCGSSYLCTAICGLGLTIPFNRRR
jgi:hypothetical protein